MASSSQPSIPLANSSQAEASSTLTLLAFESFPFEAFFKATYPDSDTAKPSGKRKTTGKVQSEYLHCPADARWSNNKKDNTISHAKRKHQDIIGALSLEDSISFEYEWSYTQLETTPNRRRQQYTEAIVGLTRCRLPFSAVKWDELQALVLSANPAVEDLLITSRHEAMLLCRIT
ncbi:hypothetical protein K402DRAFT_395830 [Aulographum hederae CBS 113979]|uniref:Uncharacterized protein n=1 Tax=Aulographum hederae CBS 113979 TaxID=1176131 RepID=A0A6G1GUQ8_9PEZI|nr:hypothetical protein K402DRAFT_395830 [Aulographum hederae CBS 113979]